jgi:hypothetical protein
MRGGARSPGARWESEPQYPNRSATPHAAHGQPQLPYMNFLGQRPRGHLDSATYRSRRHRGRAAAPAGGGGWRRLSRGRRLRGGACAGAADGDAATAGVSGIRCDVGPALAASCGGGGCAAGPAWARLAEVPPPRASRPVGGGHRGAAAPPTRAMRAAGLRGRGWWRRHHHGPLGPWARGVEAPPRLLRGRCTRRGLRVRGWWERRHCGPLGPWAGAYCGSGARGGACMGAAGGNTATAGLSLPLAPYNKPVSPGGP